MPHYLSKFRRLVFRINQEETTFARRGFHNGSRSASLHLERVGRAFIHGYDLALGDSDLQTLARQLDGLEPIWRGFAFEGAAMALTLMDHLSPWSANRLRAFLAGPAEAHAYMVHVGVGWGIARLPALRWRVSDCLGQFDGLLRWLAVDGYGFHEGYFHWPQSVVAGNVPKRLTGYSRRAFDQGLGRSVWFVDGADVDRIPITIGKFAVTRRADLWSGVGLACTYAGGANPTSIETLRKSAGSYWPQLALGAAFAAKARERAGNQADHTDVASRIFCGVSAATAANITDEALKDLPTDGNEPKYEVWRERVQTTFAAENLL